jgi:nitronate monooxygenase
MMAKAWNQTRVSEALGIEYPMIQGPLGGLSSQRLTAAVSNFGGLGSFGAHGLEPSAIEDVIAEIRSLTEKPFAMNLWVSMEDPGARTSDAAAFRRALSHLSPHIDALGGTQPEFAPYKPTRFEDQARVLLDANVPALLVYLRRSAKRHIGRGEEARDRHHWNGDHAGRSHCSGSGWSRRRGRIGL